MANNDNPRKINRKRMQKLVDTVNDRMRVLYRDTYNTSKDYSDELDATMNNMERSIDDIISRNSTYDLSNVARLLSRVRLQQSVGTSDFKDSVEQLFNDDFMTNTLLTTYMANKDIIELDNEIDTVCRYMPKLEEALEAKKDAVLSSDDYSRDFLNAISVHTLKGGEESSIFTDRIKTLKRKYKLLDKFETYYDHTQKYGECFVYKIAYTTAISDLLKTKYNTKSPGVQGFRESVNLLENGRIPEKFKEFAQFDNAPKCDIKVEFDFSGLLDSAIREHEELLKSQDKINESTSVLTEAKKDNVKFDITIKDELEIPRELDTNDGTYNLSKNTGYDQGKVKVPGCVVKELERANVIPIYIDEICLGYYYMEFSDFSSQEFAKYSNINYDYNDYSTFGGVNTSISDREANVQQFRHQMLNYMAYAIASSIDSKFVNANQDLAKEIYAVLKHNDVFNNTISNQAIKISFLSESDVVHMKFREDPDTHRGISDLYKALIPAKLYSCLYITTVLGQLTRGQDKRVYYVKQNIEQNISKTMLNVINQIKKSNFGLRQVESMNTILNLTGRFNDFVIPIGPSGDSPVQFEVMPGQEINPMTELLEQLEDMAVNSTDTPLELVNARTSMDFATQITMTNVKFLRHVLHRQSKCNTFFGEILTTIYNTEYDEDIIVEVSLPTPIFLNMTNLQNIINNAQETTNIIASYEYDENDEVEAAKKTIFMKRWMQHKLATYVKQDEVDKIKREVEFEYSQKQTKQNQEGNEE